LADRAKRSPRFLRYRALAVSAIEAAVGAADSIIAARVISCTTQPRSWQAAERASRPARRPEDPMAKTPVAIMKERFGEKAKLVEAVKGFINDELWLARQSSDRGGSRGLEHVSNAKLLRLHATFSEVQQRFGTRAKLIDAILDTQKRGKDAGLRKRLEAYPVPRLFDLYKSSVKRSGGRLSPTGVEAREAGAPARRPRPKKAAAAAAVAAPKKKAATKAAPKKKKKA
jgi:hypothetical protein